MRKVYFHSGAKYSIDGIAYHFETSDDTHAHFRRGDGSGTIERFTWEELKEIVGSDRWDYAPKAVVVQSPKSAPDPLVFVWELPDKQQKLLLYRWFFVTALERLHAKQVLKLTPADVIEKYYQVHSEATKEWRAFIGEFGKQYYCSKDTSLGATPSVSSILKWRRQYRSAGGRIDALLDKRGRATGLNIDQESYKFIISSLRQYLLSDRHSASEVVRNTLTTIKLENERRRAEGKRLLQTRSRSTLHEWISGFNAFEVEVSRFGKQQAIRKIAGVGKTERATRPGQVFLVDEWEVDACNLALSGPIREGLDDQTIKAIKAMPKVRRWMYVVMDVATRYIVGFGLSTTQNSESAVRALRMATQDKSDLAEAAGCECGWQGLMFEAIESDTGPAFHAAATRRAVEEALATYVYPQVGQPQLRGIIERLFLTFGSQAMPYIPGQTFRDPKTRGDYDTEGRAVLSDDQLALIFIRYIVDVYHQSQHRGLFGETPDEALIRLGGTVGVPGDLSPRARRRAFGIRQERKIAHRGLRFLGIDYGGNNPELLALRKSAKDETLAFYVDPEDLGTISVWNDGQWIEAECSIERFHGIRLVDWIAVSKVLRKRYHGQAELKASIVFNALQDMKKRAEEPQRIMGVLPQMPTAEDLQRFDKELYWGLSVIDDTPPAISDLPRAESGLGYVIGSINQSDPVALKEAAGPNPTEMDQTLDDAERRLASDPLITDSVETEENDPGNDEERDDDHTWWHEEDDQ